MFTETLIGRFSMRDVASFKVEVTKNILLFAVLAAITSFIAGMHFLVVGNLILAIVAVVIFLVSAKLVAKTKKDKYFIRVITYESDELGSEM